MSVTGRWSSLGCLVYSNNKSDRHDTTDILLKVALSTINLTQIPISSSWMCNVLIPINGNHQSSQIKDYKIDLYCFSAKYAAIKSINLDNVYKCSIVFTCGQFQWAECVGIVLSMHCHQSHQKSNLFPTWCSWKMAHLALNSNHSINDQSMVKYEAIGNFSSAYD